MNVGWTQKQPSIVPVLKLQASQVDQRTQRCMGITHFLDSKAAIERQIFQYGTLQVCNELNLTKCTDQEIDSVSSNGVGYGGSWEAGLC